MPIRSKRLITDTFHFRVERHYFSIFSICLRMKEKEKHSKESPSCGEQIDKKDAF
jgi:hypothetical protein